MGRGLSSASSLGLALLFGACDARPMTLPVNALALQAPDRAGAPSQLLGRWNGSSVVESTTGAPPACLPKFWEVGYAELISAEIVPVQGTKTLNLHIRHQTAGEFCHLEVTPAKGGLTARPFDDKGTGAEGEHW